jgi:hypothetical protein
MKELQGTCHARVERARRGIAALAAATDRIADAGTIVDRRALPHDIVVFVSYAHEDKRLAQLIERRLASGSVKTWIDERSLTGGASVPSEVAERIQEASHFVVIVSPQSERSRWVERESSLALASEIDHGRPRIIPILHGVVRASAVFADKLAIPFSDPTSGFRSLWAALGVPERARWSLSEVGRLLRRSKKLLDAVEWCGQADGFLTVDPEVFEELEGAEKFLADVGTPERYFDFVRFARTSVTYSDGMAEASFCDELYSFAGCYFAGSVLLEDLSLLIEEILASVAPPPEPPSNAK